MRVRLCRGTVILEATDPDRVELRVATPGAGEGGTRHYYALTAQDLHNLGLFQAMVVHWRARLGLGMGPPDGFDRDITIEAEGHEGEGHP